MSAAFLPSPARAVWQLGPLPIKGYALCTVAGIAVAVLVADRRYRRAGGQAGVVVHLATWAILAGLIGARLYSVLTDYQLYFGGGHDWLNAFKLWEGGLGLPGALAAAAAAAAYAARRAGIALAPLAGAAAPAVAFGLAVGVWGNWFSQQLYGRPSTLPWAVEIAPAQRVPGYESYATFQPTFLYQSLWDLAAGLAVIWAARRFALSGDRALALCLGADAVGRYWTESLRIDFAHHLLGLRLNQWVMLVVLVCSAAYLYLTAGGQDSRRRLAALASWPLPARPPGRRWAVSGRSAARPGAQGASPAAGPGAGAPPAPDASAQTGATPGVSAQPRPGQEPGSGVICR